MNAKTHKIAARSTWGARRLAWTVASATALCAIGCMPDSLPDYYGRPQVLTGVVSVNGTDVLAGMFGKAGHEVSFRRVLMSSDMESANTVVWFPDDFAAPSSEVCEWFDEWLSAKQGRMLIYVGRDFDAAPLYWREMLPRVTGDQEKQYRARARAAEVHADARPKLDTEDFGCEWFVIRPQEHREARELGGPWATGIDGEKTSLELGAKLVPRGGSLRFLTSGGDLLVARIPLGRWKNNKLLIVANGSFLLNLPLVNHEHRKLAAKLIASAGKPGRVVFLESSAGGPPIDPPAGEGSMWTVFGAWPLNAILLHLAVVGVIFCFARWPIFGRPQNPASETITDFGKHVSALGELLRRTRDRNYAKARLPGAEQPPAPRSKTE